MRFSCNSCAAKFTIADEKVRGKSVAVKCSKCGARITVDGKSLVQPVDEAQLEERTRVASFSDLESLRASSAAAPPAPAKPVVAAGWYAIVAGQQLGPLSAQATLDHLIAGRISERTYVWRDGQADWKHAEEIPELVAQLKPVATVSPTASRMPAAPAAAPVAAAAAPSEGNDAGQRERPAGAPSMKALDQMLFAGEFEDLPTVTGRPLDAASLVAGDLEEAAANQPPSSAPQVDPFAEVSDSPNLSQPPPIGEQTRFFMQKAGVTRRNPPWKIALAVCLFIGVPVLALYALSQMRIVNLQITQLDEATGEVSSTPVFSSEGMSGLRDLLLGKGKQSSLRKQADKSRPKPATPVQPPVSSDPAALAAPADGQKAIVAKAEIKFDSMSRAERAKLQGLYAEGRGLDKPKVDTSLIDKPASVDGQAGLEPKVVRDVVGKNLKAFQVCTETELRRNPTFKGGKIKITITVGTSGIVTRAAIDRQDINGSDLGSCLKDKAKRVVFPRFEGEPFDVEIPLVLAGGA